MQRNNVRLFRDTFRYFLLYEFVGLSLIMLSPGEIYRGFMIPIIFAGPWLAVLTVIMIKIFTSVPANTAAFVFTGIVKIVGALLLLTISLLTGAVAFWSALTGLAEAPTIRIWYLPAGTHAFFISQFVFLLVGVALFLFPEKITRLAYPPQYGE